MNTLERSKLLSFIPVERKLTKAIEDVGEEANVYSGMTTSCRSCSLIYKPARKDSVVRDEDGGSMIEFALIAPLLFLILFGIIEFGVLLFDKAMLTNASREGARAGIVYDYDDGDDPLDPGDDTYHDTSDIHGIVEEYCGENLISFSANPQLTVSVNPTDGLAGEPFSVSVTYQFRFLVFSNILALIGGDIADPLTLRADTVMRFE